MSDTIDFKGGDQLLAYLDGLETKIVKSAVRSGLVAAAAPIRDEARRLARKSSGKMARAIKTGSPKVEKNGDVVVRIRLDPKGNDHAFLGLFHERGVKPHYIMVQGAQLDEVNDSLKPLKGGRRRADKTLVRHVNKRVEAGSLKIGGKFVGPVVHHPGHSASPFMRPAADAKAKQSVEAFAARARDVIEGKTGLELTPDMDEAA